MSLKIGPKIIDNIAGTRAVKKLSSPAMVGMASAIALISTTSKDILSTYYYVTQSLKNKKIPEEKRKFVAALDLSNGIMNATFGVGLGLFMDSCANKIYKSKLSNLFTLDYVKNKLGGVIPKGTTEETLQNAVRHFGAGTRTGLCVIATLVGSQIIGKRIITPLIATPMASWFKKKMEKSTGEKNTPELERIISTRMPKNVVDFKASMTK